MTQRIWGRLGSPFPTASAGSLGAFVLRDLKLWASDLPRQKASPHFLSCGGEWSPSLLIWPRSATQQLRRVLPSGPRREVGPQPWGMCSIQRGLAPARECESWCLGRPGTTQPCSRRGFEGVGGFVCCSTSPLPCGFFCPDVSGGSL